jgi:glutaredoxin
MRDLGYTTVPQVWIRPHEGHRAIHIGGYEDLRDYVNERYADTSD